MIILGVLMATQLLCPSCRRPFRQPTVLPFYCRCGFVVESLPEHLEVMQAPEAIAGGPGTEMLQLTKELGITEKPNCSCRATAKKMNELGVEGCEQQREWIVQQLEGNAAKWSWLEVLQIAASNAVNPLALSLAFRGNIYHALLDEAIARAKARLTQ